MNPMQENQPNHPLHPMNNNPSGKSRLISGFLEYIRRKTNYEMPRMGPLGFAFYWRFAPDWIDSELVPGIRIHLDLRDNVQRETYWHGGRAEPFLRKALLDFCSKGTTRFFDIGANFGFYSTTSYRMSHRWKYMRSSLANITPRR